MCSGPWHINISSFSHPISIFYWYSEAPSPTSCLAPPSPLYLYIILRGYNILLKILVSALFPWLQSPLFSVCFSHSTGSMPRVENWPILLTSQTLNHTSATENDCPPVYFFPLVLSVVLVTWLPFPLSQAPSNFFCVAYHFRHDC